MLSVGDDAIVFEQSWKDCRGLRRFNIFKQDTHIAAIDSVTCPSDHHAMDAWSGLAKDNGCHDRSDLFAL